MIKAIETKYKGYRFRSRLEARWAVFFDALGIEWEYEPEGFELPDGMRYLPDFFVHFDKYMWSKYENSGYWIEIKATKPTHDEIQKMQKLVDNGSHHGYIVYGLPGENVVIYLSKNKSKKDTEALLEKLLSKVSGFQKAKEILNRPFDNLFHSAFVSCCNQGVTREDVSRAIEMAKSARFEFGEQGAA